MFNRQLIVINGELTPAQHLYILSIQDKKVLMVFSGEPRPDTKK